MNFHSLLQCHFDQQQWNITEKNEKVQSTWGFRQCYSSPWWDWSRQVIENWGQWNYQYSHENTEKSTEGTQKSYKGTQKRSQKSKQKGNFMSN